MTTKSQRRRQETKGRPLAQLHLLTVRKEIQLHRVQIHVQERFKSRCSLYLFATNVLEFANGGFIERKDGIPVFGEFGSLDAAVEDQVFECPVFEGFDYSDGDCDSFWVSFGRVGHCLFFWRKFSEGDEEVGPSQSLRSGEDTNKQGSFPAPPFTLLLETS